MRDRFMHPVPNREAALEQYRVYARRLNKRRPGWIAQLGSLAISSVHLRPGDVAMEVGCGDGYWFPLIERCIGAEGKLVGIDQSPEMLARARERVESSGWTNVTLIEAPAEEAEIDVSADIAVFLLTHDIMRSSAALANVLQHVKPRGTVVAAGGLLSPWWLGPVNVYVRHVFRRYVTTLEGLAQPWSRLASYVPDLQVETFAAGRARLRRAYVAWGTVPEAKA